MTNFEKIKSMSIEEMAVLLADEIPHGDCCNCWLYCGCIDTKKLDTDCQNAWLEWLESEVE